MTLRAHLLDLSVQVAHPLPDAPSLDLDLLLAEAAASPHSPPPAADLPVIGVGADQTRQEMVQPSGLHLQAAFMGASVLGKDLEDDLRPVEHPSLERQLEVALLARAQIFVADDEVELALDLQIAQRLNFAHADEMRGVDFLAPLHV